MLFVTTAPPHITLQSLLPYLGLLSFLYTIYKELKSDNKEREKAQQARFQHLENAITMHADLHKNAVQEREHLVKMNEQRLGGIDRQISDFNTLRHDVEAIKAEQKVMATKIDAVQSTLKDTKISQDSSFKEILELIKKGTR